jgi:hypothetical protein
VGSSIPSQKITDGADQTQGKQADAEDQFLVRYPIGAGANGRRDSDDAAGLCRWNFSDPQAAEPGHMRDIPRGRSAGMVKRVSNKDVPGQIPVRTETVTERHSPDPQAGELAETWAVAGDRPCRVPQQSTPEGVAIRYQGTAGGVRRLPAGTAGIVEICEEEPAPAQHRDRLIQRSGRANLSRWVQGDVSRIWELLIATAGAAQLTNEDIIGPAVPRAAYE